jgi:uncharacterized membrane protein YqjE
MTERQTIPTHSTGATADEGEDTRSVGAIMGDISRDMSTLVRQEMDLAKTELKQEIAQAGKGAGMLGGAGIAGLLTLFFLSLALTYLLDNWMPVELGALLTALLWAVAGAALAARGRKEIKRADLQLPKTQTTLKEDVRWAKAQRS